MSAPLSLTDLCRAIERDYKVKVTVEVAPLGAFILGLVDLGGPGPYMQSVTGDHILQVVARPGRQVAIWTDWETDKNEVWNSLTPDQQRGLSYVLLHELGHILCNHTDHPRVVDETTEQGVKYEVEAWDKAEELLPRYGLSTGSRWEFVKNGALDTYREAAA